jgi:predicted MPP superfamily phosphohydrolase
MVHRRRANLNSGKFPVNRRPMFSRRAFLASLGAGAVSSIGLSSYALAEPRFRLVVRPYRLTPIGWPAEGKPLRIAAIADIHACDPWMPVKRIERIVAKTNALKPDLTVLLGDYMTGAFPSSPVAASEWGRALGKLKAPLGVYGVLGNHDWWHDPDEVRRAFSDNEIPLMENDAVLVRRDDGPAFWLAGLGDQWARPLGRGKFEGEDDLAGTLAQVRDDGNPVVLLAHEPDIFPDVPARVNLTLSGHTHGGQVAVPYFGRPIVPSAYGRRLAYGHVVEDDRHLIVSGGLGCSTLPVRVGVPPEIVLIEVGGTEAAALAA